jgi:hypothetical protein
MVEQHLPSEALVESPRVIAFEIIIADFDRFARG